MAASRLNSIDALTTGVLSASIVETVGLATDVNAALTSAGISLSSSILVTVNDASASVADLNIIDGQTTGMVMASVSGIAANLDLLAPTSTNNAYTLTVTDSAPVAATVLSSLDAKTTVAVNASSVLTISGTSADVASVAGAAGITKAVGFNSTLSGAFTVSDINIIGAASLTGSITYTGTTDQVLNFSGVSHALTITGGDGINVITGGAGADTFFVGTSTATGVDTITDFVGASDKIYTASTNNVNALSLTAITLTETDLAAALATFAVGGDHATTALHAYTFSVGTDQYLIIDNGTTGYDATTDSLVKITGLADTLTKADIFNNAAV